MSQQCDLAKRPASQDDLVEYTSDKLDCDSLSGETVENGDDKAVRSLAKRSLEVPAGLQVKEVIKSVNRVVAAGYQLSRIEARTDSQEMSHSKGVLPPPCLSLEPLHCHLRFRNHDPADLALQP